MGQLRIPSATPMGRIGTDRFLGADYSKSSDVSLMRSPQLMNIIRDTPGKVRKWEGFSTVATFAERINGVHFFRDLHGSHRYIHSGTKLYDPKGTEVMVGLNDDFSSSVQLNGKLLIFDGKSAIILKEEKGIYTLSPITDNSYIPTTVIGRKPVGGGTLLENVNMVQSGRKVRFYGDAASKIYQMPYDNLDAVPVKCSFLNGDGSFTEKTENTDFSVDRVTGKVTFTAAPPAPSVIGTDNVYFTVYKTNSEYLDRINKSDVCTLYGSNGARDRVFCSGGGSKNNDYYSALNDCTYFGDLNYSVMGGDDSAIMGYTVINDRLAAHLNASEDDTNIILREGITLEGKTQFKLAGGLQGDGAVSKHTFGVLATEPVFCTKNGVSAVTSADYSSERYAQNRSYYVDGLLKKQNLKNSYACLYNGFYILAAGEYIFALDGAQPSVAKNLPYATRVYEGYVRNGVNARIVWNQDGKLMFGTADGKIKEFSSEANTLTAYNDDGQPIKAIWATPFISGKEFCNKKKFKKISLLLGSAVATGCRIWVLSDGVSQMVYDYDGAARYFAFSQLQFSKISFKTDKSSQIIEEKLSGIKPDSKKVQFIFENDRLNEPFSLEEFKTEYTETR